MLAVLLGTEVRDLGGLGSAWLTMCMCMRFVCELRQQGLILWDSLTCHSSRSTEEGQNHLERGGRNASWGNCPHTADLTLRTRGHEGCVSHGTPQSMWSMLSFILYCLKS